MFRSIWSSAGLCSTVLSDGQSSAGLCSAVLMDSWSSAGLCSAVLYVPYVYYYLVLFWLVFNNIWSSVCLSLEVSGLMLV